MSFACCSNLLVPVVEIGEHIAHINKTAVVSREYASIGHLAERLCENKVSASRVRIGMSPVTMPKEVSGDNAAGSEWNAELTYMYACAVNWIVYRELQRAAE